MLLYWQGHHLMIRVVTIIQSVAHLLRIRLIAFNHFDLVMTLLLW